MSDMPPPEAPHVPHRPEMDRRQIEFPPLQTHVKAFEAAMVGFSILCVIVVLIILLGTDIGNETR